MFRHKKIEPTPHLEFPFKNRRLFHKLFEKGTFLKPDSGHEYRLVAGFVRHVGGANSLLYIYKGTKVIATLMSIASATCTASFQLNSKILTNIVDMVDTTKIWHGSNEHIALEGAATVYLMALVEERW